MRIIICMLLLSLMQISGNAQGKRIKTFNLKLDFNTAMELNQSPLGIRGDFQGGKAEVRMYAKKYRRKTDINEGLLYGVSGTKSGDSYQSTPWIRGVRWSCLNPFLLFLSPDCKTAKINIRSSEYREFLMPLYTDFFGGLGGNSFYEFNNKKGNLDVVVEVEVFGTMSFSKIKDIRLPGIKSFWAEGAGGNGTNGHRTLAKTHGCFDKNGKACRTLKALAAPKKKNDDVILIAHRGFWEDKPENTVAAIREAKNRNWSIIEVDAIRTKDNVFVLSHDLGTYRLASVPKSKSPKEGTGVPATSIENLFYHKPNPRIPGRNGGKINLPPLKNISIWNRDEKTTVPGADGRYATLDRVFDLAKQWDIVISIDFKDSTFDRFAVSLVKAIELARQKGVLNNLHIKIKAKEPWAKVEAVLKKANLLKLFKERIAVSVVTFGSQFKGKPLTNFINYVNDYVDNVPNLVIVETHQKGPDDFFSIKRKELGNQKPYQWIQNKFNLRACIYALYPGDCRGAGVAFDYKYQSDKELFNDFRGNLEWLIQEDVGVIIADRIDILTKHLKLFGQNSKLNGF